MAYLRAVFTVLVSEIRHSGAARLAPLGLLIASAAMGQAASGQPNVRGVVFDSLRGVPLSGAFVMVSGIGRSTTSDSRGRFRFDSLGPGTYTFAIQHDVLDSIGVGSITSSATLRGGDDEVTIAIPSFATLWRRWCQGSAPKDTGLVHGTVRDAAGRPLSRATVDVSWTDYSSNGKSIDRRGKAGRVAADTNGNFALCGIPANTAFMIHAAHDSATSGTLDLVLGELHIIRRDLRVAVLSQGVGTIAGLVTQGGQPFPDARVAVAGQTEQRTGRDGKFFVRDVPAGTRQVEIFAVGMSPAAVAVDVVANDTALVTFDLQRVVALPAVKVEETAVRKRIFADIDERKREGLGHFRDSTEIGRLASISAALGGMTGVRLDARGRPKFKKGNGECDPMYLIDGLQADSDDVHYLRPDQVVALEVYPRASEIPSTIGAKLQRKPTCGLIAFWTRRFVP
jgi:hypothetical protein